MRSLAMLFLLVPCVGLSAENRLVLADQSDFSNTRGFYLDMENSFADGQTGDLSTLRMILGVADGNNWRFLQYKPMARLGDTFVIDAHIDSGNATLSVNGTKVVEMAGGFMPLGASTFSVDQVPTWARSAVNYYPVQLSIAAKVGTGATRLWNLDDKNLGPLALFESSVPIVYNVPIASGQSVDLEARVRFDSPLDLKRLSPFIDRYGQATYAKWPGKVASMSDIIKSQDEEARLTKSWTRPATWDAYGGAKDAGWKDTASGYYHTVKHGSFWWMVSPLGNPLFYTGVCTSPAVLWDCTPVTGREFLWQSLPPKTGGTAKLWMGNPWGTGENVQYLAQHSWNLQRLFGTNFEAPAAQQCVYRLARWGFIGMGKWSNAQPRVPHLPVLSISGVDHPFRHYDVFDSTVKAGIEASLRSQITPMLTDPWVLGWSIGNEYDEIVNKAEVVDVLSKAGTSPLRQALIAEAVKSLYGGNADSLRAAWGMTDMSSVATVPDKDVEPLRQFYARAYYGTLYSTVKKIDPNHLYYGFWIVPGWWENESDWDLIAPYCDVIGYDRYAEGWSGIEDLLAKYDKPVLLGEFSFPAWYDGRRGFGRYGVYRSSDADSGASYAKLVGDASRDPKCIGTMWFQYRDQPLTGRGPGSDPVLVLSEHYAFGLVDGTNRPKWDLVKPARDANLKATQNRITASK